MKSLPKRKRFEKDIITKVFRSLGGVGKILVRVGQEVTPDEIIGSSEISLGFRTINLAKLLSVSPKDIGKYLKKGLGEKIYKGELLAFKEGGFLSGKKVITSPTDGILDFLNTNTGELKMNFLPRKKDLVSGVYGVVEELDELKGYCLIKTQASRVYGVYGTGKIRDGILIKLGSKDDLLSASKISPKYSGQIILGGSLVYKEAISSAISGGIHGIITGGLNARDYKGMVGDRLTFPKVLENDIGVSLVSLEGFGSIPIGLDVYEILSEFEGRFISIDGNSGVINLPSFESSSMSRIRKVSLPKQLALEDILQLANLEVGQKVRVIGSSFRGEQGKVISLNQTKSLLSSGLSAYLVTIETKSRKIQIAENNLEII